MADPPRVPWLRLAFVLYCTQAGVLFLLLPWSLSWQQTVLQVPGLELGVGLHPMLRGAVSGFGLVHLVWGAHDLERVLSQRFGPPRDGVTGRRGHPGRPRSKRARRPASDRDGPTLACRQRPPSPR